MVFYFSGTGNSTYVAVTLSNFLNLKLSFIPETDTSDPGSMDERVLLVFPVYSWGVPPLVTDFISNVNPSFWENIKERGLPVDCVMTCGDEVAMAPEMIQKTFDKLSIQLNSIWSVIMPNNYVLLPGFDVDPQKLEKEKLAACEGRILEIAQAINRGDKRIDVTRGSIPRLKTKVVFPLFKRWGIFTKKWHFTDSCISCGKCANICPLFNVSMKDGHPQWGRRCCSCLGCYHVCPVHAVAYGKETGKKGQYLFPLRKISLRNCHNQ